jgi:uncharacterized protein (UPF0333 family)
MMSFVLLIVFALIVLVLVVFVWIVVLLYLEDKNGSVDTCGKQIVETYGRAKA